MANFLYYSVNFIYGKSDSRFKDVWKYGSLYIILRQYTIHLADNTVDWSKYPIPENISHIGGKYI